MRTLLQILLYSLGIITLGCAKNDNFEVPILECSEPTINANKSIDAIYYRFKEGKEVFYYNGEEIVSGIVISSDQAGNFFQQLIIVDNKTQKPLTIKVDIKGLYSLYPIGTKIYLKLNGLYVQHNYGMLTIGGGIYTASSGNRYPDVLSGAILKNSLFRTCSVIKQDEFLPYINHVTITQLIEDKSLHGKLITIDNIQFERSLIGETYYDPTATTNDSQGYTLRKIVDIDNNSIVMRTGKYTNGLKDCIITEKSGRITGIVSEFIGVLQFYPRTIEDINLDQPPLEEYY